MAISLQKGQKISLTKDNSGLSKIVVGLGWDEVKRSKGLFSFKPQAAIDCDASVIMLTDGRLADSPIVGVTPCNCYCLFARNRGGRIAIAEC